MRLHRPLSGFASLVVALLALAGLASCGGDDSGNDRVLPTPRPAPTVAGRSVPGGPGVEDPVAIIGIARDATAPMHALPGVDQPIVAQIPSTANNLSGFGEAFETEDGRLWWLVRYENSQGWIEPGAAYLGPIEDVSVTVAGTLAATTYPSFEDLVAEVGRQYSDETTVVEITPESEQGAVIATIDALTPGDALSAGSRVIITGQSGPEGYRLQAAQRIPLCVAGVNPDGSCT